jgi:hypothetical protein
MESYHYEWRVVHDGVGKVPNVRYDASTFFYNNCIWVACGGGAGLGKSSEVWKFDTIAKEWSRIDIPPNECPSVRDGHSGTYIGNGKYVIFGGQGFSEPNKKLGRESEQMKAQTHCKRDVFNDLWEFDCNTLKWTPLYPDGLSFPMGRRGHSAIYIPKNTLAREEEERMKWRNSQKRHPANHHHHHSNNSTHGHDEQSQSSYDGTSMASSVANNSRSPSMSSPPRHHLRHGQDAHSFEPIPEHSLVIFGGAGIELSKYTEQLYNDVWVYSFELNTWRKHETRGLDPRPTTNHRVIRNGEYMLIIGGIIGPPVEIPGLTISPPPSAGGGGASNIDGGDIQVLNLRTATWTFLRILDHAGRPTKVGSLGFSVVPEVNLATDHMTYLPPTSILVFGGKENVDSKLASTTKQTKRQKMIATTALPANARHMSPAQRKMIQQISEKTYAHFHEEGDLLDPWSVTDDHLMLLDIERCTLTILQTKMEGVMGGGIPVPPPEGRYAHCAVSASAPREYEQEQLKEEAANQQASANGGKYGGRTARAGGMTTRRMMTSSRTARGFGGDGNGLPPELPVMYVYGGCRLENNGYCDPAVYALVKVFPPDKTAMGGMLTTGRSDLLTAPVTAISPPTLSPPPLTGKSLLLPVTTRSTTFDVDISGTGSPTLGDDDFSRVSRDDPMYGDLSGFNSPGQLHTGNSSPLIAPRFSQSTPHQQRGGLLEQSTFSATATGAGAANGGRFVGGLKSHSAVLQSIDLLSQPSIWTNVQKKEQLNNRDFEMQTPANWEEMKLLLTSSRSLRIVHGQVLGSNGSNSLRFGATSPSLTMPSMEHSPSSRPQGHSRSGMNHSISAPSFQEFTFRGVSSFNRGASYSPFNDNISNGLDGTSGNNNSSELTLKAPRSAGSAGFSPTRSRGNTASTSRLTTSMSAVSLSHTTSANTAKPMSAQSRLLAEEARNERVQQIKASLKPIVGKQTKTLARETYKQLFPPPANI